MLFRSATAATGVATLGAKATRGVVNRIDKSSKKRKTMDKAKSGFSAFKDGVKNLFNE